MASAVVGTTGDAEMRDAVANHIFVRLADYAAKQQQQEVSFGLCEFVSKRAHSGC